MQTKSTPNLNQIFTKFRPNIDIFTLNFGLLFGAPKFGLQNVPYRPTETNLSFIWCKFGAPNETESRPNGFLLLILD